MASGLVFRQGVKCNHPGCSSPGVFTVITRAGPTSTSSRYADPLCAAHVLPYLLSLAARDPSVESIRAFDLMHGPYTKTPETKVMGDLGLAMLTKLDGSSGFVTARPIPPKPKPVNDLGKHGLTPPVAWEKSPVPAHDFTSIWPTGTMTKCETCGVLWKDHAKQGATP